MQLFVNNWSATLTASATAASVQLTVDPAEAAKLSSIGDGDYYLLTLALLDGAGAETAWEVVKATGAAGGVIDVDRAQEGTESLIWESGSSISARATKGTLETLRDSTGSGPTPSAATPQSLGEATAGESDAYSRGDHVHPLPAAADIGAATAAQGALADTAVQPAELAEKEQVLAAGSNVTIDRTDPDNPIISASITGGGGGDVVGPATATNNEVALFDGMTGDLIKGGGLLGTAASADTADFAPASHVDAGGEVHAVAVASGAAGFMTGTDKEKLDGIASGATANSSDATLKDRANHTGVQAQSTVTNLTTDLAAKQATLVSATNIKTINGSSILGSGDLVVSGGASFAAVVTESTTARTLATTDAGAYIRHTNASASTVTVAPQASQTWLANTEIHIRRAGAGNLTLTPGAGVTLNAQSGGTLVMTNAMTVTLKRVASDEWDVIGQTVPA